MIGCWNCGNLDAPVCHECETPRLDSNARFISQCEQKAGASREEMLNYINASRDAHHIYGKRLAKMLRAILGDK